jgi:hypothetical protein
MLILLFYSAVCCLFTVDYSMLVATLKPFESLVLAGSTLYTASTTISHNTSMILKVFENTTGFLLLLL